MLVHTSKQMFSETGTVTITSANGSIEGEFVTIQCIADTVFTTLADSVERAPSAVGGTGASVTTAQTYPAGFTLYGRFTQIALTSGAVRVTFAERPFA